MAVKMIHQKNTIFLFALISFLIIPGVRSKKTIFSLSHIGKNGKCVYITVKTYRKNGKVHYERYQKSSMTVLAQIVELIPAKIIDSLR